MRIPEQIILELGGGFRRFKQAERNLPMSDNTMDDIIDCLVDSLRIRSMATSGFMDLAARYRDVYHRRGHEIYAQRVALLIMILGQDLLRQCDFYRMFTNGERMDYFYSGRIDDNTIILARRNPIVKTTLT